MFWFLSFHGRCALHFVGKFVTIPFFFLAIPTIFIGFLFFFFNKISLESSLCQMHLSNFHVFFCSFPEHGIWNHYFLCMEIWFKMIKLSKKNMMKLLEWSKSCSNLKRMKNSTEKRKKNKKNQMKQNAINKRKKTISQNSWKIGGKLKERNKSKRKFQR